MISVWSYITNNSENFLTHDANGSALLARGNYYISDQLNPSTRQFIWDKIKKNYYTYEIRLFWLDADEPARSQPGLQW